MCTRLEKCMLAGNRLKCLPESMERCRKLGLLRVSCNELERVPEWVWVMPELAFFSCAGNPCFSTSSEGAVPEEKENGEMERNEELESIPWDDLTVQHVLGRGASGLISQALWKRALPAPTSSSNLTKAARSFKDSGYSTPISASGTSTPYPTTTTEKVAIKLFHGTLTSDGSPLDELAACIAIGSHTNVISSLGTITSHPSSSPGLVLELIPKSYINLGLPPDFNTCTRDTFSSEIKGNMSVDMVKEVVKGIASAMNHLHSRGVAHGDLYAHNILVDLDHGRGVLGDFGAATLYKSMKEETGEIEDEGREEDEKGLGSRYERLEVLAFGHLIEDMIGCVWWIFEEEEEGRVLEGLLSLWRECTCPLVERRPRFSEVVEVLERL